MVETKILLSRRAALPAIGGSFMAFSGCQPEAAAVSVPDETASANRPQRMRTIRTGAPPRNLTPQTQGLTPQFYEGANNTPDLVEIGYSLHCGGTRAWMRRNGRQLARWYCISPSRQEMQSAAGSETPRRLRRRLAQRCCRTKSAMSCAGRAPDKRATSRPLA